MRCAFEVSLCAALCAGLLCSAPGVARAEGPALAARPGSAAANPDEPWPLAWRPEWARVSSLDYALTGAGAGLGVSMLFVHPAPGSLGESPLGVDETLRDLLRGSDPKARSAARVSSDALAAFLVGYPLVGDALLNAAWYRQSGDAAWQLAWIDLEVAMITLGVTSLTKALVGRERPYGRECSRPGASGDCSSGYRYESHFSGHASATFAAAAVTCTHHAYLPLWGNTAAWVPCAAGFSLATTTGVLRIVADHHYASDVVVGAAVGSAVGVLVPWLHYRSGPSARPGFVARHRLLLTPAPAGLQLSGVF